MVFGIAIGYSKTALIHFIKTKINQNYIVFETSHGSNEH